MKTIMLSVAILTSSLFNLNHASTDTVNMKNVLEEVVTFKEGSLNLEKDEVEFVKICFRIDEDGKLDVLNINYSNEKIKNQLIDQLNTMVIYGSIDTSKMYNYKFTFKVI